MTTRRRRSERAGRAKLRSPGRPSVRRHEKQRRFWAAIATGHSSEDAAVSAGVSPAVGTRWFREAGGMAASHLMPSAPPLSGRYLSFTEREQIALSRVQGHGVREIARRRSEEHTSELQSRLHLVCRLLLEKKKTDIQCKRYNMQD